jgi:hypothetical protein
MLLPPAVLQALEQASALPCIENGPLNWMSRSRISFREEVKTAPGVHIAWNRLARDDKRCYKPAGGSSGPWVYETLPRREPS